MPTHDDPENGRPDIWASWPSCPRHHLEPRVELDGDATSFGEWARWQIERGAHQRRGLGPAASDLLRLYTRIRQTPAALRAVIESKKRKTKAGRGKG